MAVQSIDQSISQLLPLLNKMARKSKAKSKHTMNAPDISPMAVSDDDDDLMNDLLSQLDSRDQAVKEESPLY